MSNPNDPAAFRARLEAMPPKERNQMMTLLQTISRPPETLVNLFDRIGLTWERKEVDGKSSLVIEWSNFMAGEAEIQRQGPLLKQMMSAEFGPSATDKIQVDANGQVQQVNPPTEFKLLDENQETNGE